MSNAEYETNNNNISNPFSQSIGFLLSLAGRAVKEKLESAIKETGLKTKHLGILNYLKNSGPLPQNAYTGTYRRCICG
jgi:hypothetical protein